MLRVCNPVTTAHPDHLLAKGLHLGLEWEVTKSFIGHRCGYVRLPKGHPWHGQGWEECPAAVHGGLTFAEPDTHCGKGGEDDAWWRGFDCGHYRDAVDPALLPKGHPWHTDDTLRDLLSPPWATIKTTEYVVAECRRLAEQAIAAMG